MKSKIISGLVLLCVIVCTIVVFHLIFDEHTKLFYINVITTCFAEAILLANIPLLSSKRLLTFKNAASSTILDAYAVVLFLWTVVCSAFIEDESGYKTLYIGMLIISVIFVIALGVVELGGNFMQKEEESLQQTAASKKVYLLSLTNYFLDIQEILSPFHSDWKDDVLRNLKVTLDKISMIPTEKLERNEMVISEMNQRMEEIKGLFSSLPDNADDTRRSQITRKIDLFKNYVTTIKSSL